MSFNYQVILRPKDIKFSVKEIPAKFDNGKSLKEVYDDIVSGKILCKDIPAADVVWDSEKWEWYTLSNRRLWVFKELERSHKITYIGMSRIELTENESRKSPKLYSHVDLYNPEWEMSIPEEENTNKNKIMSTELHSLPEPTKTNPNKKDIQIISSDEEEWVEKSEVNKSSSSKVFSKIECLSDAKDAYRYRSNQSLFSNASCSSISRSERIIDKTSGLSGYGNYHTYKTEYLDKIKTGRNRLLRKYKPYNVSSSSYSSGRLSRSVSYSCEFSEKVIERERSYSVSSLSSNKGRERETVRELETRTHRLRLYSDNIDSDRSSSRKDVSESAVVPYKGSSSECSNYNGIKLSDLYGMWQQRRIQYLKSSRLTITNGSASGYLCGLCFKNFNRIVDLQQHCEALLHYACITCGKFFSSYASLGQHCQRLRHKKD